MSTTAPLARRRAWLIALLAGALLGASCATNPGPLSMEAGTGVAYGLFDLGDSEIAVTHVVLMRVRPTKLYMGGSGERTTVTFRNGDFVSPNLTPGTYMLGSVYSGQQPITLQGPGSPHLFEVHAGRAVHAGSFRVDYRKPGLFSSKAGEYARIDSIASERQLLIRLLAQPDVSAWANPLRRRLSDL